MIFRSTPVQCQEFQVKCRAGSGMVQMAGIHMLMPPLTLTSDSSPMRAASARSVATGCPTQMP